MIRKFRYLTLVSVLLAAVLQIGCSRKALSPAAQKVSESRPVVDTTVAHEQEVAFIDPRAYNLYVNGIIYEEIGNFKAATQSYTNALQYYPNSYEIRYSLAAAYYQLRQYHDAISVLDVIDPEDAQVYTMRGAAYLALGLVDSAETAFGNLVKVDPTSTMGYSYLAGIYRQQGNLDSLIWAYQHLTRLSPNSDRQWRELGRLQVEAGNIEGAKHSFQKSLDQVNDATNMLSYLGLASIYQSENHDDSALTLLKQAVHLDPDNKIANRELSVTYYRLDSLQQAIGYAKHLVSLKSDDHDAVRRLAMFYMQADSLLAADSLFTELTLVEKNPADYYFLGQIAINQKRFRDAANRFTVCTQMVDTAVDGWMGLAFAYRQMKEYDQEITSLKSALGHVGGDENQINLLFSLGAAYEQSGQVPQAESTFQEIIARSPDYAPALNYLGYMLADRGEKLDYAKKLIEKAVKAKPDNAAYLDSYGWVLYRLGHYKDALKQLKKAVSLDSDPTIFDHLGDTYKALGKLSDARVWWQKALKLSPDDPQIKEKLGN